MLNRSARSQCANLSLEQHAVVQVSNSPIGCVCQQPTEPTEPTLHGSFGWNLGAQKGPSAWWEGIFFAFRQRIQHGILHRFQCVFCPCGRNWIGLNLHLRARDMLRTFLQHCWLERGILERKRSSKEQVFHT